MAEMMNIKNDSKIVSILTAQANNERLDSEVVKDAEALYAELYNNPNPMNKYAMSQLITFAVDKRLPAETNWRSYIADEKQIGDTDEAAFRVRNEGIKAFIQADGATTARTRVSHKQVVLDTVIVSARPVVGLRELRAGKTKMSDLVVEATREMANAENKYIENVMLHAASQWSAPFFATGAGIVKTTLNPMIQHWMRSGSAAIVGDISVIQKLAEQTGFTAATGTQQFSPNLIDEFNKTGRIGFYNGASVVQFVNPYEADGITPVMLKDALYIIPTAARVEDRPLKVVRKGNILTVDHTDIDEMTYEIRMDQAFGAGIAMGNYPEISVYLDLAE